MTHLTVLGSSNAIASPGHNNTHFAIITHERKVLIDCGSNPVVSIEQSGEQVNSITDIILTHFHPDHVSGLPLLLMDMWLMGRRQSLNVYGLDYTIDRVESMMELFGWTDWPNFYKVNFIRVELADMAVVLDNEQMRIYSSPVNHFLPNICLRIELKTEDKIIAYSCDTEPCQAVLDISNGADILLHEASGPFTGHSSAAQAGETARRAEVGALYLIHYPTGRYSSGDIIAEARASFPGKVVQAVDFMKIDLNKSSNL